VGAVGFQGILDFIMYVYNQLKDNNFNYLEFMTESAFHAVVGMTLFIIMNGVSAVIGLGSAIEGAISGILNDFRSAQDAEDFARQVKARPTALVFASPEAKGAILWKLSQTFVSSFEEHQEAAILVVVGTMQSRREWRLTVERISPTGTTVGSYEAGMARLNYVLDGGSQRKFNDLVRAVNSLPESTGGTMYAGDPTPVAVRTIA
jgi:hypothetical protein